MCQRASIVIALAPLHHCYSVSCCTRAIPISACQTVYSVQSPRRRCFLRVQINTILIPYRLFPEKKKINKR
jgi:hypothetical protein